MMFSGAESVSSWVGAVVVSNVGLNGLWSYIYHILLNLLNDITRTDALSKTVKNEGRKPRWSQQDAFILVHKYVFSTYSLT